MFLKYYIFIRGKRIVLEEECILTLIDALSLEPVARDDVLAGLLAVRSHAIDVFEGHPSEEAAVLQALSTGSREQLVATTRACV